MAPTLTDKQTWMIQMLEHRRSLFERVLAAFPDAQKKRTTVDHWRLRLRPSSEGTTSR
jgi:hypothetical protein